VVASCATTPPAIVGWPIASVPIGLVGGLPVGLAMIARPGREWALVEAARRVETVIAATDPLPAPAWKRPERG
jgi:aspartyl-tRNA(Asn)/glutamyl-tRNA(Gln) amidotransferase subunit A